MDSDPAGTGLRRLGDYQLVEQVSEGVRTRCFRAEQISVKREVWLDRMKPGFAEDADSVAHFLEDVKAKASVDHPVIGLVYEAGQEDGETFYTREILAGESLGEMAERGAKRKPAQWIETLRQVAEAALYLEERKVATVPMAPCHVFVDGARTRPPCQSRRERRPPARRRPAGQGRCSAS